MICDLDFRRGSVYLTLINVTPRPIEMVILFQLNSSSFLVVLFLLIDRLCYASAATGIA